MSGNVWEWMQSPYKPYPYVASDDREDRKGSSGWVLRGGSFYDSEGYVRAAARNADRPGDRFDNIGFRVVVSRF